MRARIWFCALVLLLVPAFFSPVTRAQTTYSESVLFTPPTAAYGAGIYTQLVQAGDGYFYGATFGGQNGTGPTIFKVSPTGQYSAVYTFPSNNVYIVVGMVVGGDGNIYGTGTNGGTNNQGFLFKVSPSGTYTLLHTFCSSSGCPDGSLPYDVLVQGSDGSFYGTTVQGGTGCTGACGFSNGSGTVFKITPAGTLTTLYNFCSQPDGTGLCPDGAQPYGGLVQASDGNFYGTTSVGGQSCTASTEGCGTVFRITPSGTLTVIRKFSGVSDSAVPASRLVQGANGDLYGTTEGTAQLPQYLAPAVAYEVPLDGSKLTTLLTIALSGREDDLFLGSDGSFYSATISGGTGVGGGGGISKITPPTTVSTVYSFTSTASGLGPAASPIQGADGNFYGTTINGGTPLITSGAGTVYEFAVTPSLTPPVAMSFSQGSVQANQPVTLNWSVANAFSVTMQQCYASIQGSPSGAGTWTGLQGGTLVSGKYSGSATITPTANGAYIYALTCGGMESGFSILTVGTPTQPVNITTSSLPAGTVGVPYSQTLTASGGYAPYNWSIVSGSLPAGLSLQPSTGVISGTPTTGGTSSFAVEVKDVESPPETATTPFTVTNYIKPTISVTTPLSAITSAQSVSVTATLNGGSGNSTPTGSVQVISGTYSSSAIALSDGSATLNIPAGSLGIGADTLTITYTPDSGSSPTYISSSATASLAVTEGTYTESILFSPPSASYGDGIYSQLIQASDGSFYGVTVNSLTGTGSTIFKVSSTGQYSVVYTFPSSKDVFYIGLTEGIDGNLYGSATNGGTSAYGPFGYLFKVSPNGTFTLLHLFCATAFACPDGGTPYSVLVQGSDGNFYGTTLQGGANAGGFSHGAGSVFKMTPSGTLTTLYSFCGQTNSSGLCTDGAQPAAGLVQASDGNFYGTTEIGGQACTVPNYISGCGTIFKITPSGALTTIYNFTGGSDGYSPAARLVQGPNGNLYGTTQGGTAYEVSLSGINFTTLSVGFNSANNTGSIGANNNEDGLFLGSDGEFYGTSLNAATAIEASNNFFPGAIYQVSQPSTANIIYYFGPTTASSVGPGSPPIQGSDGNFYGATINGGTALISSGAGTVYELAISPSLIPPVAMSFTQGSVQANQSVTLNWSVANAFSVTMQQCYASIQGSPSGAGTWTGLQSGALVSGKYTGAATITPTANGVYTYALTCGGMESGFAILAVGTAATPTFSVAAGTYTSVQTVTISDATASATIYYTTNGTAPTTSSTVYSGAISVSASETLEAIATAAGYSQSAVASAAYTINLPVAATPTFSVTAGTYTSTQTVTISDTTPNSTIYYTTNGTTPTTSSTAYSGSITVSSTETLKAIAIASGYTQSAVNSAAYTINLPAATPTFSVAAGTYTSVQTVAISDTTAGATIYYTANGSTPTTSSTVYSGAITVNSSETIEAIAIASGYSQSAVASAAYTINLPAATPTFSVAPGTYTSAQTVLISDTTSGATIYYTTNGSTPTTSSSVYSSAISVSSSETLQAIAVASGYSQSAVASAAYTINLPAATPTFSVAAGTYTSVQTVSISDATAGAIIYYTTNGTTPTSGSTVYSGPITVSASETLEAIATSSGYSQSGVATAAYTINLSAAATPTFSVAAGTYSSAQTVTITDTTGGATIYYTINGNTPTTSSPVYSGPITVSSTETLKAIATASGYSQSVVASAAYTINLPAAPPTFSVAAGTYTSVQTVSISDTTAGAAIYYTTNGTTPTTSSTVYSGAISVNSSETIEAIAIASGYSQSAVASVTYTINLPAPDYQLTVNPSSLTIVAGQSGTAVFTVTPINGFNSTVTFACSGLPSEANCTFSPASVTPNGAPVSSTLTVSTTAASAELRNPFGPAPTPFYALLFPGLTVALGIATRRRRTLRGSGVLNLLAFLVLASGLVACGGGGGGSSSGTSNPGTPVGTDAVSVSASAGSGTSHTAVLTITITH